MDNFFINSAPFVKLKRGRIAKISNRILKALGLNYTLQPGLDIRLDMNSIEQRINYYHLLDAVITYDVEGEVAELGCFTGQCALLFQNIITAHRSDKKLHLYDSFEKQFAFEGNVEQELINSFNKIGLSQPIIHKGYFEDTIPAQLPEKLSFVHIDCGWGGDPQLHKKIMLHCLQHIYPRLSKGAVCVMMDYHDAASGDKGLDVNPGVKVACDEFFIGKPEQIVALYGNEYSHAFFRKIS